MPACTSCCACRATLAIYSLTVLRVLCVPCLLCLQLSDWLLLAGQRGGAIKWKGVMLDAEREVLQVCASHCTVYV